jgi:cell division transport system permease protein
MSKAENKMMRRRLRSAYLSSVISISLVLLLVGVAALLLVNAKGVSDYFKEHMQVSVLMKPDISDAQTLEYQVVLDSMVFVHSTEFISKAQGTREMEQMLGEGFLDVFEASPIPASVNVRLKAEYVSPDSLETVKAQIMASPIVDEVEYQQSLIEALNSNLTKISAFLGVLIILLLFISFVLINNTVRLNVFSRRFTIHTMKLVGATRSFIRGPFLVQAVFQGLFAAFIAIVLLLGLLFFVRSEFAQLFEIFSMKLLLLVIGIVLVSGVLICVVSTYFVVNKLVASGKDELYY